MISNLGLGIAVGLALIIALVLDIKDIDRETDEEKMLREFLESKEGENI